MYHIFYMYEVSALKTEHLVIVNLDATFNLVKDLFLLFLSYVLLLNEDASVHGKTQFSRRDLFLNEHGFTFRLG